MSDEKKLDLSRCPKCGATSNVWVSTDIAARVRVCNDEDCELEASIPDWYKAHAEAQFVRAEREKARADRAEAALRKIDAELQRLCNEAVDRDDPRGFGVAEGAAYGYAIKVVGRALASQEPTP